MKKLFKRFAAGVTAACMCAAMAAPMETSADTVTWICGDVNNDGIVSMSDLTNLNKYLAGMVELVDYSKADVTGNYVVNVVDALVLQSFLVSTISNLPYVIESERVTVSMLDEEGAA